MNKCITDPGFNVPYNQASFQIPHSGNGYCEYFVYDSDSMQLGEHREYIQGELKQNLINGKRYCVTFYLSLLNNYGTAIDRFGAYFDDGSVKTVSRYGTANVTPQIESPDATIFGDNAYLSDTLNWMKVQGSFIATGNEKYITLGNFHDYAHTHGKLFYPFCLDAKTSTAYYIDDISVIEITTQANAGRDTTIYNGDSTYVGLHDIGDDYTWYANGTQLYKGSEAGLWVKPTVTTTYICKQQVCSAITYDTCVVKVLPKIVGISPSPALPNGEGVRIYPNPVVDGVLNIESAEQIDKIEIYDVIGDKVKELPVIGSQFTVNLSELPKGVYFVRLYSKGFQTMRKVVLQ
jgi:hypothetical protein